MALMRKPIQGVLNIIYFNWHFYIAAGLLFFFLLFFNQYFPEKIQVPAFYLVVLGLFVVIFSLVISCYIYDFSGLYSFKWLPDLNNKRTLNIHAGFDETSEIIQRKFQKTKLTICDFYNPKKHTEISINRARSKYPPKLATFPVSTDKLPFPDNHFDFTLLILAAHEIRNGNERILFFKELNRVTKSGGQIYVMEHLRDFKNFLAFNIGFFHFYTHSNWIETFQKANLNVECELKNTPFISTFVISKNGNKH